MEQQNRDEDIEKQEKVFACEAKEKKNGMEYRQRK